MQQIKDGADLELKMISLMSTVKWMNKDRVDYCSEKKNVEKDNWVKTGLCNIDLSHTANYAMLTKLVQQKISQGSGSAFSKFIKQYKSATSQSGWIARNTTLKAITSILPTSNSRHFQSI